MQQLRDALGIRPGDDVVFSRHGDHVAVRPVRSSRPLRGRFRDSPLSSDLLSERSIQREVEDAR